MAMGLFTPLDIFPPFFPIYGTDLGIFCISLSLYFSISSQDRVPLISVPFHRQVPRASSLVRRYLVELPKSHRKPSREAPELFTNLQLELNTPLNRLFQMKYMNLEQSNIREIHF